MFRQSPPIKLRSTRATLAPKRGSCSAHQPGGTGAYYHEIVFSYRARAGPIGRVAVLHQLLIATILNQYRPMERW